MPAAVCFCSPSWPSRNSSGASWLRLTNRCLYNLLRHTRSLLQQPLRRYCSASKHTATPSFVVAHTVSITAHSLSLLQRIHCHYLRRRSTHTLALVPYHYCYYHVAICSTIVIGTAWWSAHQSRSSTQHTTAKVALLPRLCCSNTLVARQHTLWRGSAAAHSTPAQPQHRPLASSPAAETLKNYLRALLGQKHTPQSAKQAPFCYVIPASLSHLFPSHRPRGCWERHTVHSWTPGSARPSELR